MNISIVSLFPHLYYPFLQTSLVKRAQELGHVSYDVADLFSYCYPKERVDGDTFGPGSGMVIRPEVIERAVSERESSYGSAYNIFFSPRGEVLDQHMLQSLYKEIQDYQHVAMFPARYEGMDDRIEHVYADRVISIGHYVLMGGDLPAMVLLEGLLRYFPGVVGKEASVQEESFMGPFVDYPEYTRPVTWKGISVPDIVRSGDHKKIAAWRFSQAVRETVRTHFTWLASFQLTNSEKREVRKEIPKQYLVLLHTDVILPDGSVGETSVTSIDIHDIARSATTYGVDRVFIVTPLKDQQAIVERLLSFWCDRETTYNTSRYRALRCVELAESLDSVISKIKKDSCDPLLIGTSAHRQKEQAELTFYDHGNVWAQERPVMFVLGTAAGLSADILQRCDYVLDPVEGLTEYNHLSVRSAAAVILDRWIGNTVKYKRKNDETKT